MSSGTVISYFFVKMDPKWKLPPKSSNLCHYIAWFIAMLVWRDAFLWRPKWKPLPKIKQPLPLYCLVYSNAHLAGYFFVKMGPKWKLPQKIKQPLPLYCLVYSDARLAGCLTNVFFQMPATRWASNRFWHLTSWLRRKSKVRKREIQSHLLAFKPNWPSIHSSSKGQDRWGGKKKKQRVPKHPSGYCVPATFLCQMVISLGEST